MANVDDEVAELVALELEALEATYAGGALDFGYGGAGENGDGDGDDGGTAPPGAEATTRPFFRVDRPAYPPIVSVHLTPRGCGRGATFVEAVLTLAAPRGYPAAGAGPVAVSLSAVRGLGEARAASLAAALAAAADAAVGDAALGSLIEAGLDGLTSLNAPEPGALCALCLDPLVDKEAAAGGPAGLGPGAGPPRGLLKLACYHCLHLTCAARWWAHGRGIGPGRPPAPAPAAPPAAAGEEAGGEEEGAGGGACLPGETCADAPAPPPPAHAPPPPPPHPALACPVCRAEAGPLAPPVMARLDALAARVRAADGEGGGGGGVADATATAPPSWQALLPPPATAALRTFQAACAAGLASQRARGGLVEESYGVSLAEMADRAAADLAAARAAAGAEAAATAAVSAAVSAAAPPPQPRSKPGGGRGRSGSANGPGRARGRGGGGGGGGRGRGGGSGRT